MPVYNKPTSIFDNLEDDDDTPSIDKYESNTLFNTKPKASQRKVIPYNTLLSSSLLSDVEIPEHPKTNALFPVPKKSKTTPSTSITTNNNGPNRTSSSLLELWPDSTPADNTPLKKQAEQLKNKPISITASSSSSSLLNILPPPSNPIKNSNKAFIFKPVSNLDSLSKNSNSNESNIKNKKIKHNELNEFNISFNAESVATEKKIKITGVDSNSHDEYTGQLHTLSSDINSSDNHSKNNLSVEAETNKISEYPAKTEPDEYKHDKKLEENKHDSPYDTKTGNNGHENTEKSTQEKSILNTAQNPDEQLKKKVSEDVEYANKSGTVGNATFDKSESSKEARSISTDFDKSIETINSHSNDDDIRTMQSLFSGYSSDEDDDDTPQPQKGYFTLASPYPVETPTLAKSEIETAVDSSHTIYSSENENQSTSETKDYESETGLTNEPDPFRYHTSQYNQPPEHPDNQSFDGQYHVDTNQAYTQTRLPPPDFDYLYNTNKDTNQKQHLVNSFPNLSMQPKRREWKDLYEVDATVSTISANSLQNPNWYMENKIRNEPLLSANKKYTLPTRTWSSNDGAAITVSAPRKDQKHKHQINWLAMEANQREAEINAISARARQHKYDSKLKYGW